MSSIQMSLSRRENIRQICEASQRGSGRSARSECISPLVNILNAGDRSVSLSFDWSDVN